jgi:hypothetical protein
MGRNHTEIVNEKLGKGQSTPLGEIGISEPIEKVTENDFVKTAKLERFMNDVLTIIVHPSAEEGALDIAPPQVNGLNQPIIRGVESKVKRKYVEALARCRTTKYDQKVADPSRPENIQMAERTVLSYPFAVLSDPAGIVGRQWLEGIVAQP